MKNKNKQTKFPVARIKKIMQKDEEVGKVAQATPIVISKALELFLALIIDESSKVTLERGAKKVEAYHLKHAIETIETLDFLKEIVQGVPDPSASGAGGSGGGRGESAAAGAGAAGGAGSKRRRKAPAGAGAASGGRKAKVNEDEGEGEEGAPPAKPKGRKRQVKEGTERKKRKVKGVTGDDEKMMEMTDTIQTTLVAPSMLLPPPPLHPSLGISPRQDTDMQVDGAEDNEYDDLDNEQEQERTTEKDDDNEYDETDDD